MKKFKEPNPLNDVSEFHDTFNLPVLDTPTIPSKERCELRINLLEEELDELKEAINSNDLVEVIDAFCDIQYVLSGAILEFGFGEKFKDMFEEVQRSNMSKTCKSIEEAQATQEHYFNKDGTASHIVAKGDEFLVYRTSDNKVLKSINYSEANLTQFL
ncbi:MAG: nucleoside triphosphate pyrophosphohydrolase family protein [Saprospiraceae bacterium]|nr:nucleoside triphosphate pyrophosphohydrolase family protein [Bacteroidia bacterium]NNE15531.1 nucleoside triphosphate pyrophosphohydrolase family protein [Saprospiraceae bacterium]NNL91123.1 nucleoside triphosphate pyrophosphohydrolase family protein [Saprospiraceae bacterium]